jgi:hypothetical protein
MNPNVCQCENIAHMHMSESIGAAHRYQAVPATVHQSATHASCEPCASNHRQLMPASDNGELAEPLDMRSMFCADTGEHDKCKPSEFSCACSCHRTHRPRSNADRQAARAATVHAPEPIDNGEQFDNIPLPDFGDQFGINNGFPTAADDAQRRADQIPATYAGQLTPAQHETRRRFAAVAVALADDGFDIDAPANAHVVELLESWATAWAEASK